MTVSRRTAQNTSEAAEAALEAMDAETHRFEVGSLRVRNTLVPINQLPSTILADIFMSVAALPEFHGFRWNRMTGVCTYWHETAIACSHLWTTIDFNSHGWKTYLSRSNAAPLTLNVRGPDPDVFDEFSRTLVGNLHRVRECRLASISVHFKSFFDLLESTPPPMLETLELTSKETNEDHMPVFDKHVPSLRQLRLRNVRIPWRSPCLSGLTHLSISLDNEPKKSDILKILESTTVLQSLELYEVIPRCPVTIDPYRCDSSPIVRLANLSQLRLREATLSICAHFVAHLEFPDSAQIHFISEDSPNVYRLAQVVDFIAPHTSIDRYKLIVNLVDGVEFTIQSLKESLSYLRHFSLRGIYELARTTQSLGPVFGKFAQLTCLDISLGEESLKSRHWWKDLGGMEYISDLRVRKVKKAVSLCELLRALEWSEQLPDTSSQILLPRLRRLHLTGLCTRAGTQMGVHSSSIQPQTISELLEPLLQMRWSQGVGIEELKITGCDFGFRGDFGSVTELVDNLDYDEETCDHCRRIAECSGFEDVDSSSDDGGNSSDDTDSSSDDTDSSSSETESYSGDPDIF